MISPKFKGGMNKLQNSFIRHTQGQASHFRRRPESSQYNCLLDAGIHRHDDKDT